MARTSKSRGASGFQMRSGNTSPYKFLGKVGKALGGIAGGAVGAIGGALGIGQGQAAAGVPGAGMAGGMMRAGGMDTGGVPFAAAQKAIVGAGGNSASAMLKKSPMKAADAILVSGAYDAASGHGTKAIAQIAEARALSDMVNSVEETVNRSSRAQNRKDRTRQKVQDRSHHKYGKFRERKGDEWYDESADHMHTPPHGF